MKVEYYLLDLEKALLYFGVSMGTFYRDGLKIIAKLGMSLESVADHSKYLNENLRKFASVEELEEAERMLISCINTSSKSLIIGAYKVVVNLLLEYKETKRCIEMARVLKAAGRWFKDIPTEMCAYEALGKCYSSLLEYNSAIDCYSKMLRLALGTCDYKAEFKAYDNLSKQYFYMNNAPTAMFFHRRMVEGDFEPKTSVLRKLEVQPVDHRMGFKVFTQSLATYKSVAEMNLEDFKVEAISRKERAEETFTTKPETPYNIGFANSSYGSLLRKK